jgi:DNA modification methylase/predicted RNA-binding Zn-ribbon protein involved in translation (DUF1610 family)
MKSNSPQSANKVFASKGIVRQNHLRLPLFDEPLPLFDLAPHPLPAILKRLTQGKYFTQSGKNALLDILDKHHVAAPSVQTSPVLTTSAGKNTYTYDAHTYHTKVPPQGIASLIQAYLPEGGLVFDPFAGSGMTGVAAIASGYDCILSELSPAACFIASQFTTTADSSVFEAAVNGILDELDDVRRQLFTTVCRECGKDTEILYTVWSYQVTCYECGHEFVLWDHCRRYGKNVREHQILAEFPCPNCHKIIKKSQLERTAAIPVLLGYKCCGRKNQEVTHALTEADLENIRIIEMSPPVVEGFYPTRPLPDGVNLRQPKKHGFDRVDRFYTSRNLAALSHLWHTIHRVESTELAAQLAFVFTSLYQRVTRFSEFRFWGGSGNTARFNVPYIFNEANVFITFARKARTIQDHLETTARFYSGSRVVMQNSATQLADLPDESIDFIFTDPPFGANINYSEMNILWEAWLGAFTDTRDEAIVNKFQHKGVAEYEQLMLKSLQECYRVLRRGHWMLLVFMNSSEAVWKALRGAITNSGFAIHQVAIFDKKHGTFKQFVSDNTAGCDLILHCLKPQEQTTATTKTVLNHEFNSIVRFLERVDIDTYVNHFLHVDRAAEVDYRKLYSEWMSESLLGGASPVDFSRFRAIVSEWLVTGS